MADGPSARRRGSRIQSRHASLLRQLRQLAIDGVRQLASARVSLRRSRAWTAAAASRRCRRRARARWPARTGSARDPDGRHRRAARVRRWRRRIAGRRSASAEVEPDRGIAGRRSAALPVHASASSIRPSSRRAARGCSRLRVVRVDRQRLPERVGRFGVLALRREADAVSCSALRQARCPAAERGVVRRGLLHRCWRPYSAIRLTWADARAGFGGDRGLVFRDRSGESPCFCRPAPRSACVSASSRSARTRARADPSTAGQRAPNCCASRERLPARPPCVRDCATPSPRAYQAAPNSGNSHARIELPQRRRRVALGGELHRPSP